MLIYLSLASKSNSSGVNKTSQGENANQALLAEKDEDDEDHYDEFHSDDEKQENEVHKPLKEKPAAENVSKEEKMYQPYKSNTYLIFHFIMFVLSVYGVMLLTNWSEPDFNSKLSAIAVYFDSN